MHPEVTRLQDRELPTYSLSPALMTRLKRFVGDVIRAKHGKSGARYDWDGASRRFTRNIEGYMAEVAACSHYGVIFPWHLFSGCGDDNHDISVDGHLLGVKATSNRRGRLLIKHQEAHKEGCPGTFLLCFSAPDEGMVELAGVISRDRALDRAPRRMRDDGPLNYVVEVGELRRVRETYQVSA